MTIMLIDDNPLILKGLELLIVGLELNVIAVTCEGAAVAALGDGPAPALIISDWHLAGGRTGGQAVSRIRQTFGRDIPAIVVTADTSQENLEAIRPLNCMVLHKPIEPEQLKDAIQKILAG